MEENQTKYEPIFRVKQRRCSLFPINIGREKSNNIIVDLVDKIQDYEQKREMEVDYEKSHEKYGERIAQATIKSKDGVVDCVIKYKYPTVMTERNGMICANLYFNSEDESLKEEFNGLVKILTSKLKGTAII
jgi:hypothetical protein